MSLEGSPISRPEDDEGAGNAIHFSDQVIPGHSTELFRLFDHTHRILTNGRSSKHRHLRGFIRFLTAMNVLLNSGWSYIPGPTVAAGKFIGDLGNRRHARRGPDALLSTFDW